MDKSFDPKNLPKIFGVEGMVTPKTLVDETEREIRRKSPNDASNEIRVLLDEITIRVVSKDLAGVCKCIEAIQLRVNYIRDVAENIKRELGQ